MPLPLKKADCEANSVLLTTSKKPQPSAPASVASLAGSPVMPVGSPALALQQQLVDRMAEILNGSEYAGVSAAADQPVKWPMPARLVVIMSASAMLWLAIVAVTAQII